MAKQVCNCLPFILTRLNNASIIKWLINGNRKLIYEYKESLFTTTFELSTIHLFKHHFEFAGKDCNHLKNYQRLFFAIKKQLQLKFTNH